MKVGGFTCKHDTLRCHSKSQLKQHNAMLCMLTIVHMCCTKTFKIASSNYLTYAYVTLAYVVY